MSKYHCLHDAPSATYEECFCGKCKEYGDIEKLFEKECPSTKPCHCKPITEHPDVQRLIKQAVLDGFKIKDLQAENKRLKGEEPIPEAWWAECPKLAQRTMERIIDKNDELQAENERLKAKVASRSKEIVRLVKENTKLQAQIDKMHDAGLGPDYTDNLYRKLQAENAKLKKFIEENNILDLAEDLNYRMAILDGSWPQSVEILTKALENAKALKGKTNDR